MSLTPLKSTLSSELLPQSPSTGSMLVLSLQSRTRVSADLAGHSRPLEPSKVSTRSLPVSFCPSLNSSLSTVTRSDSAATEAGNHPASSSGDFTTHTLKMPTHTLLKTETARPMTRPLPPVLVMLASRRLLLRILTHLRLPLPNNQCLSQSRPTLLSSRLTRAAFLTLLSAVPLWIMPCSLLDTAQRMDRNTGSSRTPGVHPGVKMATSSSPSSKDQVFAVSKWAHFTQLSDSLGKARALTAR